jgi:hypothetical protein
LWTFSREFGKFFYVFLTVFSLGVFRVFDIDIVYTYYILYNTGNCGNAAAISARLFLKNAWHFKYIFREFEAFLVNVRNFQILRDFLNTFLLELRQKIRSFLKNLQRYLGFFQYFKQF